MTIGKYLHIFILYILLILTLPLLGAFTIFLKVKKFLKTEVENNKNITGEVAVVTGSAKGLGRDIAIELAKRGCCIAVVDIRHELAQETAEYLAKTYGVKAKAYKVDVSNYQKLVELKYNVTKDLGDTTILVNNAGIIFLSLEPKPEEIQKMINVNFTAICLANRVFLPKMKELNRGYILTISSVAALATFTQVNIYGACKAAIRSLSTALRLELQNENKNIKSTTIMPWFLTSNRLVEEVINSSPASKFMFMVKSQTAARIAVEAMLNNEEEVTIPRIIFCFYKIKELFPAAVSDRAIGLLSNWVVQQPVYEEIIQKDDTLKLLQSI